MINKTTSSHLRIAGKLPNIYGVSGAKLKDLTYTVMLDGYAQSRITIGDLPISDVSGEMEDNVGSSMDTAIGTDAHFSWQLQSPSNILLESGAIVCPLDTCRINPIASPVKNTQCEWFLDGELLSKSCNPATLYP